MDEQSSVVGHACQVCALPLNSPKKYQIHKVEDGYALGGKPFILSPLPQGTEGHACHKCYQANMKARKRTSMDPSALEGATPVKKPARKVTSARPSTSTDHAVIGINALKNLASLVTSSCKQCRGPWLHISHEFYSTELCLLTFTCHDQHVAKWSSEINELVPLEPSEIPHEFSQPH